MTHDTQSAQIIQKQDGRNTNVVENTPKTMLIPNYPKRVVLIMWGSRSAKENVLLKFINY